MQELQASGLQAGPAKYLEGLNGQNEAKSLINDHRLLHSFWEEVISGSAQTEVGAGWTAEMILLAHDAVVRRCFALVPDFKHDSPLKQRLQAAIVQGVVPMLVVPDYVSVVGGRTQGREGDLDVVVREEEPDESLVIRITQALGENIHLISNPRGPHDESYKPVYHLALIPVEMWETIRREETPVSAGMMAFRQALGPMIHKGEWKGAILRGAGVIRSRVHGKSMMEAREIGREVAASVFAGETFKETVSRG